MSRSTDGSDVSINSNSTVRSNRTCFIIETNCLFTVNFWKNKQSSVDQSVNLGFIPKTNQILKKMSKKTKNQRNLTKN